jgi:MFS family permease
MLWRNATFRHLLMMFSVAYFFGYGLLQWIPTFFIRCYGFSTGDLGTSLALTYGLGALLGTYAGGVLASRYANQREALQFRAMAGAFCLLSTIWMAMFLSFDAHIDFALLTVGIFGGATVNGPSIAAVQTLVPEEMRATAIAFIYLCSNLIGLGLGPLGAGALSDALHPYFGQQSLRYALLVFCPGYLWSAWHLWRASRTVEADLQSVRQTDHARRAIQAS